MNIRLEQPTFLAAIRMERGATWQSGVQASPKFKYTDFILADG